MPLGAYCEFNQLNNLNEFKMLLEISFVEESRQT